MRWRDGRHRTVNGWLGRPEPRYGNQAQGCAGTGITARPRCRKPHPEVYLEAFANIYRDFADLLRGESAPLLHGIEGALITHFGTVLPCSSRMAAVDPEPVVHDGKDNGRFSSRLPPLAKPVAEAFRPLMSSR